MTTLVSHDVHGEKIQRSGEKGGGVVGDHVQHPPRIVLSMGLNVHKNTVLK